MLVLMAKTGEELQDVVGQYAEQWSFKFNLRKSQDHDSWNNEWGSELEH